MGAQRERRRRLWNRPEETNRLSKLTSRIRRRTVFATGRSRIIHDGELFIHWPAQRFDYHPGSITNPQDIELAVETSDIALRLAVGGVSFYRCGGEERLVIAQEQAQGDWQI